ncbi:MAG: hypothetical protein IPP51_15595 [Bacteroidetes bacterium]|nr:hypothetical protein [Bacteroidota bacterium]
MKSLKKLLFGIGSVLSLLTFAWGADKPFTSDIETTPIDTPGTDSLHYPFQDRVTDPYSAPADQSPLYLKDPSNIKTDVQYDPDNNRYNINENMGSLFYRSPSYMSFDEFVDHEFKSSTRDYWKQRANEDSKLNKKNFCS